MFGDNRYRVEIEVNRPKWLGLDFKLLNHKVSYAVNSDLYKLDAPENTRFAEEIEQDILSLLEALQEGSIKIATSGKRARVLIPLSNKFVLVKRGMLFSSAKTYKDKTKAEKALGAGAEPFSVKQ